MAENNDEQLTCEQVLDDAGNVCGDAAGHRMGIDEPLCDIHHYRVVSEILGLLGTDNPLQDPEAADEAEQLLAEREATKGDARMIVAAAVLSGTKGPVYRNYVFKALHAAASTPLPANMLDGLNLKRLIEALKEHSDDPILWLAEASGNKWW